MDHIPTPVLPVLALLFGFQLNNVKGGLKLICSFEVCFV